MTDRELLIEERYRAYVEGFARGEANPDLVMAGLDDDSRHRLGRMIDRFLDSGPVPDPERFGPEHPEVTSLTARILPGLDGRAGGLSQLLVERRSELGLSQSDVVETIAAGFEATSVETEKIDAYYHDLEWGSLPAAGLADRVLDSLAAVLRTTRDALIEAGRSLGPGRASSAGPVYARAVNPLGMNAEVASPGPEETPAAGAGRRASPPDRIDQLFTGG